MKRAALALALTALVAAGAGCDTRHGSTKPKPTPNADDKFRKNCLVKGGDPIIVRSNGKVTRTCLISLK